MKPGHALEPAFSGVPDFIGADDCVTLTPTAGNGDLVPCMKCGVCGWSVTSDANSEQ